MSIVKEKGQVRAIGEYYAETGGVHESDSIVKEKVVGEYCFVKENGLCHFLENNDYCEGKGVYGYCEEKQV